MTMADDLISRSELRAAAIKATAILGHEPSEFSFDNCYPYWQFSKCIKEAPSVDVVPVVRCKDCRFLGDENLGLHNCDHYRGPMRVELDDFCSYGEKNATD